MLAPHMAVREKVRKLIGPERYLEIYLSAPVEVCAQRDRSGLYKLAAAGQVKALPGVNTRYEPPEQPDLVLPTHEIAVDESVRRIIRLLEDRGLIG